MRPSQRSVDGFTLLEMLVALGVFAVLGVMSTQMVTRILSVHDVAVTRGTRLSDLERAMGVLSRDVLQLAPRAVRDGFGDALPPVRAGGGEVGGGEVGIGPEGAVLLIELTRFGHRNPLGQKRADLQRVAYALQDGTLYRYYWTSLDRAQDSEPRVQTVLEDVESATVTVIDVSGNEHSFWPLLGELAQDPTAQIAGVKLSIDVPPFGALVRLWDVPQPFGTRLQGAP